MKFAELLIPTLNKIISYQFLFISLEGANHEQPSLNNLSTQCPPSQSMRRFFPKKAFHGRGKQTFLGKKLWGGWSMREN